VSLFFSKNKYNTHNMTLQLGHATLNSLDKSFTNLHPQHNEKQ
jgi:hypothetical protein